MSDDEQIDVGLENTDANDGVQESSITLGDAASALGSKEQERAQLQADIEAFLAGGGKITSVDTCVVSDPPTRPEASYGSQPI